jgi:hypothetical protein
MILPASHSPREVLDHIHAQIRIIASDAGEFVKQVQIGIGHPHSDGWRKWSASYLPGPPGPFPPVVESH